MSEKDINKEAYKQAEKELLENKVKEVKGFILETLEKIESKKKEKSKIDEELRVLKLDLEDLKQGKFEKIEERKEKSLVARNVSVNIPHNYASMVNAVYTTCGQSSITVGSNLIDLIGGTFTTNSGNSYYL
jgi:predicted nuclease with TOPRIM domain